MSAVRIERSGSRRTVSSVRGSARAAQNITHKTAYFHNATAGFHQVQQAHSVIDFQNIDLITSYSSGPLWKNEINLGRLHQYPPVLDETLIDDGALDSYQFLVIPNKLPFIIPLKTAHRIAEWISRGGSLIYVRGGYVLDAGNLNLLDFNKYVSLFNLDSSRIIALSNVLELSTYSFNY